MKWFDGRGRKVAVPLLAVSAAGWIVYIVAFSWLNRNFFQDGASPLICGDVPADDNRLNARWFQFWGFAIGGPVFYVLAFLHLLTGQWHIGLFSQFCASFYLVAGGGILFYNGVVIGSLSDSLLRFEAGRFTITEFVGCLAGVTFAAAYLMTMPFFTAVNEYGCVGYYERARTPPASAFLFTSPSHQVQITRPVQPPGNSNVNPDEPQKTLLALQPLLASGDQSGTIAAQSSGGDADPMPVNGGTAL